MKVTFLGATHEVTGSCTLLEVAGQRLLVDCGMEQGADIFVNQEIPVSPVEIDAVLLTHAHIDHSGNLPLLVKSGFRGPIYATAATADLCRIMLMDSAHIQAFEAQWRNRKAKRAGEGEYRPLYEIADAQQAIEQFVPCAYDQTVTVSDAVQIRFVDVGHLLGSSCIEIWLTENGQTRKLVFSGDVGNHHQPIIKDPHTVAEADYVVIESTYGDRLHDKRPDYIAVLTACLQRTFDRGGNVVIPSFAVGRTQEMLYFLRQIKEQGLVKGHDHFPVYVDSPLANEATGVFQRCDPSCFDKETTALLDRGVNPLLCEDLRVSLTADDSRAINFDPTPKVILSASGMCEAGRIRHHLKHNLWRPECLVLFVGYQAAGTLGRALYDGAGTVKLFGEEIAVKAEIATLAGISGHADKDGLIGWLAGFEQKPRLVFVNHGDDNACESFARCLREEHGYATFAPFSGTSYDLLTGQPVEITAGIPVAKKSPGGARTATANARLTAAVQRLAGVAKQCQGMSNKDLARLTDQITALCEKWSR